MWVAHNFHDCLRQVSEGRRAGNWVCSDNFLLDTSPRKRFELVSCQNNTTSKASVNKTKAKHLTELQDDFALLLGCM